MTISRAAALLLLTLFVHAQSVRAQTPVVAQDLLQREPRQDGEIYFVVEKQPTFPGGQQALETYIKQHLVYPTAARKANISGRVYVAFVINTDGSIQNVELLKGIGMGCDEEAVRLVKGMPRWIPGSQSGKAIRVKFNLPISFGPGN